MFGSTRGRSDLSHFSIDGLVILHVAMHMVVSCRHAAYIQY